MMTLVCKDAQLDLLPRMSGRLANSVLGGWAVTTARFGCDAMGSSRLACTQMSSKMPWYHRPRPSSTTTMVLGPSKLAPSKPTTMVPAPSKLAPSKLPTMVPGPSKVLPSKLPTMVPGPNKLASSRLPTTALVYRHLLLGLQSAAHPKPAA